MKCPKCGGENPDNAFFCGECGAQIGSLYHGPQASAAPPAPDGYPPLPVPPGVPADPLSGMPPSQEPIQPTPSLFPGELPQPPPAPHPGSANAPGAGLLPPPGQGYAPPADAYQVPVAAPAYPPPAGAYQVPPPGYQPPPYPGYAPPPVYGYAMPPDGNTSGMGESMPTPPQTQGWTFAGCLPFALFAFVNGMMTWGAIGLILYFVGFYIVYSIFIGIKGREMAWRSRRFDSIQQYEDTMRAWNIWGIGCLAVSLLGVVVYFVFVFAMVGLGMSQELQGTP